MLITAPPFISASGDYSPMIGISGVSNLSYNLRCQMRKQVKDAERNILGVMLIFTTIMFFSPGLFPVLCSINFYHLSLVCQFSIPGSSRTYTMMIIHQLQGVCLCRQAELLECLRLVALSIEESLFVIRCSCPAFFLWCKRLFRRATCC